MDAEELRRRVLERIEEHREFNRGRMDEEAKRLTEAGFFEATEILRKAEVLHGESAERWAERVIGLLQDREEKLADDPSDPDRVAADAVADAELEIRGILH